VRAGDKACYKIWLVIPIDSLI